MLINNNKIKQRDVFENLIKIFQIKKDFFIIINKHLKQLFFVIKKYIAY